MAKILNSVICENPNIILFSQFFFSRSNSNCGGWPVKKVEIIQYACQEWLHNRSTNTVYASELWTGWTKYETKFYIVQTVLWGGPRPRFKSGMGDIGPETQTTWPLQRSPPILRAKVLKNKKERIIYNLNKKNKYYCKFSLWHHTYSYHCGTAKATVPN